MTSKPFVHVQRFPSINPHWLVFCDVCAAPLLLGIAHPIRRCTDRLIALIWAAEHAQRHLAAMCPVCLHMDPITDNTTTIHERTEP